MTIQEGNHYSVAAEALADWIERQGEQWWEVDGDPTLSGLLSFPCPGAELASELRRLGGDLLVRARLSSVSARGQRIDANELDEVVGRLGDDVDTRARPEETPAEFNDRVFWLSWKISPKVEWMLCEDERTRRAALVEGTPSIAGEE